MLDYRTHTFLTVCRLGSFTQAAAELHITQPAVSQHIRQLEAHYGCALFHKGGRRGELTQAGAMLFRALETMENDEARLKAQAKALTLEQPAKAPLRFGCTRTICDYWIPRVLARHMAKHPDEMVQMSVGNTQELVEAWRPVLLISPW